MMKQKKILPLFFIIYSFIISSYLISSSNLISEVQLKKYLDKQEEIFESIAVKMGQAYWNLYSQEAPADLLTPKKQYYQLFNNPQLNDQINNFYQRRESMKDAILKRRVEIWHNILTAAKVEMTKEIFELRNKLENWLSATKNKKTKPSPEELENMAIQLMNLRNEKAKMIGFENYAEMILEFTETGADWFTKTVQTIYSATEKPYLQLISEFKTKHKKTEFELSDFRKLFGKYYLTRQGLQIAKEKIMPLMKATIENIGFNFGELSQNFVEKQMPKNIGGQNFAIKIPCEFRIIVMPDLPFYERMHELGHGLQYAFTAVKYPILKGYEWCLGNDSGAYPEGMAETIAKFITNKEWQKKYLKKSEEDLKKTYEITRKYAPVFLRYVLVHSLYEIELYNNPFQDKKKLANRLYKKYLLLDKPVERARKTANIVYVSYPIYTQNYLIADIIAWQVHETLAKKFGKYYPFDKNIAHFLKKNLYAKGILYPWKTRLRIASGKELDIEGYLKSLGLISKKN